MARMKTIEGIYNWPDSMFGVLRIKRCLKSQHKIGPSRNVQTLFSQDNVHIQFNILVHFL